MSYALGQQVRIVTCESGIHDNMIGEYIGHEESTGYHIVFVRTGDYAGGEACTSAVNVVEVK